MVAKSVAVAMVIMRVIVVMIVTVIVMSVVSVVVFHASSPVAGSGSAMCSNMLASSVLMCASAAA